jgi:hypothetical protein
MTRAVSWATRVLSVTLALLAASLVLGTSSVASIYAYDRAVQLVTPTYASPAEPATAAALSLTTKTAIWAGPTYAAGAGVAAEAGSGETVQLFRSVDAAEFDSIPSTGKFSTAPGQMEGKFFATSGDHAEQWGQILHGGDAITVETRIPKSIADQLVLREGKLDGVGPAIYANGEQLDLINQFTDGIRAWS